MSLRITDVQMLLAAANYYKGGIDGDAGPGTMSGVQIVERNNSAKYTSNPTKWTKKRRLIGAAQAILHAMRFEPGTIDGYTGHNTEEALSAWKFKKATGKREEVSREPDKAYKPANRDRIPRQRDVSRYYGRPGKQIRSQLVSFPAPYPMRLDFALNKKVRTIRIHKKGAAQLEKALTEVRAEYGDAELRRLGLDRYAGGHNHRKMRGGRNWSMHAYACAVDFFAKPNGLRMKCPQALFCRPEYKPFLDIMEQNEWLPAIRLWGKDAMHFQRARL